MATKIQLLPKYGRLTIVGEPFRGYNTTTSIQKSTFINAICDCGVKIKVRLSSLKNGLTLSCGCLHKEMASKKNGSHYLAKHPLYRIWTGIKKRCYNSNCKSYKDYGGRGIIVCDEWRNDFKAFYDWAMKNGWQKGLPIDRKDNNDNYEPGNCRFVTQKINNRNKRSNILTEDLAEEIRTQCLNGVSRKELSKTYSADYTTICKIVNNDLWT